MRRFSLTLAFLLSASLLFSQSASEHIFLIKPAKQPAAERTKLLKLFGNSFKSYIESTHEFVVFDASALKEVKQKVDGPMPGSTVREVTSEEYNTIKNGTPSSGEIRK